MNKLILPLNSPILTIENILLKFNILLNKLNLSNIKYIYLLIKLEGLDDEGGAKHSITYSLDKRIALNIENNE